MYGRICVCVYVCVGESVCVCACVSVRVCMRVCNHFGYGAGMSVSPLARFIASLIGGSDAPKHSIFGGRRWYNLFL